MNLERTKREPGFSLEESHFAQSTRLFSGNRKTWTGRSKRDVRNKVQPELEDSYKVWVPYENFYRCHLCNGPYSVWKDHLKECKFKGKDFPVSYCYYCQKCKEWDTVWHQCPIEWTPQPKVGYPRDWAIEVVPNEEQKVCFCGTVYRSKWTDQCANCSKNRNKKREQKVTSLRTIMLKVFIKLGIVPPPKKRTKSCRTRVHK